MDMKVLISLKGFNNIIYHKTLLWILHMFILLQKFHATIFLKCPGNNPFKSTCCRITVACHNNMVNMKFVLRMK